MSYLVHVRLLEMVSDEPCDVTKVSYKVGTEATSDTASNYSVESDSDGLPPLSCGTDNCSHHRTREDGDHYNRIGRGNMSNPSYLVAADHVSVRSCHRAEIRYADGPCPDSVVATGCMLEPC